jgi:ribonuclease Y
MSEYPLLTLLLVLSGIVLGGVVVAVLNLWRERALERSAKAILGDARKEAERVVRESEVTARAEMLKAREDFESETKEQRREIQRLERRIGQRESNLDRKVELLDKREQEAKQKERQLDRDQKDLQRQKQELEEMILEERNRLQRISGMSEDQARTALLTRLEEEVRSEAGALIRRVQDDAREKAEREAKRIITMAVERFASDHVSDSTTTTVALPNDDMKGRIIGREGRNIRALEAATGITVLIDDTPQAVVLSGFDPVRKEVARLSLERLVADGRIHPTRIEEVVARARKEIDETIRQAGEEAVYEVGIQGLHPEVIRVLGRLRFRHSFSQNVLRHSVEVAHLMSVMGSELAMDVQKAKRIGLLHDIGKALDHEVEGSHAIIGAEFLKRHGEAAEVINGVASHHEEVEPTTPLGVLANAADAISASRPGARSETTDVYIKRLEKLESIANGFDGIVKSYAIQAGREVRVVVEPNRISDNDAARLARDVSKRIEQELQYPGQIQVTVIREVRATEYAR